MRGNGNPTQWSDWYPPQDMIERDIAAGTSYVCVENGEIAAVFYFNVERDPTYENIDGAWLDDEPYGVVHRIAKRRGVKGAGEFCLNWCLEQCRSIRIDTHKDNAPMQKLLSKFGFKYCGIIWVLDGEERIAFQKNDGIKAV
jgi:RimJ/RimL family protein N-acetyltransferase